MSAIGRRLLLNDATPAVPPLMDALAGGEQHAAALAALKLGNLALEAAALGALDRSALAKTGLEVNASHQLQGLVRIRQHRPGCLAQSLI